MPTCRYFISKKCEPLVEVDFGAVITKNTICGVSHNSGHDVSSDYADDGALVMLRMKDEIEEEGYSKRTSLRICAIKFSLGEKVRLLEGQFRICWSYCRLPERDWNQLVSKTEGNAHSTEILRPFVGVCTAY